MGRGEAQAADEDLLSMLSAPAGEWCPFEKQPSFCFLVLKVAAQHRDVFFLSSGRLVRMIVVLLWFLRP